jgi:tRNA guanosine-2'-O-methyltransferase
MALGRSEYLTLPRHTLVVCASLVENPMNLGMLCRTAEAFRLEALVLSDVKLASDRLFRQGAVATHQWQPLRECPGEHLPQWLTEQRHQGYTHCPRPRAPGYAPNSPAVSRTDGAGAGA